MDINSGANTDKNSDYRLTFTAGGNVSLSSCDYCRLVKSISISAFSFKPDERFILKVESEPWFFEPEMIYIDSFERGKTLVYTPQNKEELILKYKRDSLKDITEPQKGEIIVTLYKNRESMRQKRGNITFWPPWTWFFSDEYSENLTYFIETGLGNSLEKKLKSMLNDQHPKYSLDGYLNRDGLWIYLKEIWKSVSFLAIKIKPPEGDILYDRQMVLTPRELLKRKIGTPLDVAVLMASLMLSLKIKPLIIFTDKKVYVAAWISRLASNNSAWDMESGNASFQKEIKNQIIFDPLNIELPKRVYDGSDMEFIRNEISQSTIEAELDVAVSIENREKMFRVLKIPDMIATPFTYPDQKDEGIDTMSKIDVTVSYEKKIEDEAATQKNELIASDTEAEDADNPDSEWEDADEPESVPEYLPEPEIKHSAEDGKRTSLPPKKLDTIDEWRARLLNLSLRNTFLNYVTRKYHVDFVVPNIHKIEDMLSNGKFKKIISGKDQLDEKEDELKNYCKKNNLPYTQEKAMELMASQLLSTNSETLMAKHSGAELRDKLKKCLRDSKSYLEETGSRNLFLAMGFLNWYNDHDKKMYKAPLVLVPVDLQFRAYGSLFSLKKSDSDDPTFNLTLIEKLRHEYKIGEFDRYINGLAITKNEGIDLKEIFDTTRKAVKDLERWSVSENEMVLGLFSFTKYLMWKDIGELNTTQVFIKNPITKRLLDKNNIYTDVIDVLETNELDEKFDPSMQYCPLKADYSQLSAISRSSKESSFILIGPPGTGKSQTIANMIAQNIAFGKSVLFVAEKAEALNVVHRRLQKLNLDKFCLELHSNKSNKLDVIKHLKKSLEYYQETKNEWVITSRSLNNDRKTLNQYVEELHYNYPVDFSIFTANGKFLNTLEEKEVDLGLPLDTDTFLSRDKESLNELKDCISRLERNVKNIRNLFNSIMPYLGVTEFTTDLKDNIEQYGKKIIEIESKLSKNNQIIQNITSIDILSTIKSDVPLLKELFIKLPNVPNKNYNFLTEPDSKVYIDNIEYTKDRADSIVKILNKYKDSLAPNTPDSSINTYIPSFNQEFDSLQNSIERNKSFLEVKVDLIDYDSMQELQQLSSDNPGFLKLAWNISSDKNYQSILTEIDSAISILKTLDSHVHNLSGSYKFPESLFLNFSELKRIWDSSLNRFFLVRFFEQSKVRKEMNRLCDDIISHRNDLNVLENIKFCDDQLSSLNLLPTSIPTIFKGFDTVRVVINAFRNTLTKVFDLKIKFENNLVIFTEMSDLLKKKLDLSVEIKKIFDKIPINKPWGTAVWEACKRLLSDKINELSPDGDFMKAINKSLKYLDSFYDNSDKFFNAISNPLDIGKKNIKDIVNIAQSFVSNLDQIKFCAIYLGLKDTAKSLGLDKFLDEIERGSIPEDKAISIFLHNYYKHFVNKAINKSEIVRNFILDNFAHDLEKFRNNYNAHRLSTVNKITSILRPSKFKQNFDTTAVNIINGESNKKRGHISIRQLLKRLDKQITKLTPCLLMSPLSVAQYLPPTLELFDIIIFDEASQIPVHDAFGAIARGRTAVIVGDPRQLPPTTFFQKTSDEEDINYDSYDDNIRQESILDECLSIGIPEVKLLWHYRSRDESLISFSNTKYYDNDLITFPSNLTKDNSVSFHFVNGVYERGGSRVNRIEAEKVVEDIIKTVKSPICRHSHYSIGVVTFNAAQQNLIEDLIDDARAADRDFDSELEKMKDEPLLVKNLENIQGDERDIIFFSITYGPDEKNKLTMNFGPLNQPGGERRLNVAITRARREVRLFSSFLPDDKQNVQARGVVDLFDYMRHAQSRLILSNNPIENTADSDFAQYIINALEKRHWKVTPSIGASSFKIDIGVIDPDDPDRYLAGIECDGEGYRRTPTAVDRNILRQDVLEELNWKILRAWSPDWHDNPQKAADLLDLSLQSLIYKVDLEKKPLK
jgi:superfamily I DNA and/or RNA helicase